MDSGALGDGNGQGPEEISREATTGAHGVERRMVQRESAIWSREVIEDIQVKAELGHYRIRGFSTLRKDLPGFDDLTFIPSSCATSSNRPVIAVCTAGSRTSGAVKTICATKPASASPRCASRRASRCSSAGWTTSRRGSTGARAT